MLFANQRSAVTEHDAMTTTIELIDTEPAAKAIGAEWNTLVQQQSHIPYGIGPTSSFDLTALTWKILIPDAALHILVAREAGTVRAILPCYRARRTIGPMGWTEIGLLPDLYPGRTGVIHAQERPEPGLSLLRFVMSRPKDFDVYTMTFVEGSTLEAAFLKTVSDSGLTARTISQTACPYIAIPENWDDLLARLGSRFRRNLRSRERKLRGVGRLSIEPFTTPESCKEFLSGVIRVERRSWKEAAGTSLTTNEEQLRYHEELVRICAADGSLQSFLLMLDDDPIAHVIGLRSNGVYLNLKSSFIETYRKYGLGTIIKSLIIRDVFGGTVKYWDFVGESQEHKMQWTDKTYTLKKYAVFSSSAKGHVLRMRSGVGHQMRRLKMGAARKAAPITDA